MSLRIFVSLLTVVALIAAGQVLFKATAMQWQAGGALLSVRVFVWLIPSLAVYVLATLAWIWVLQYVELGRAYPFMALSFIIVPLLSARIFGESLGWHYYVGLVLICAGVVITALAPPGPGGGVHPNGQVNIGAPRG